MTLRFQVVGDGINSQFTTWYDFGNGHLNYLPTRVLRFWGKNGRPDIQPKSVSLSFQQVTVTLWSVPTVGETINVEVEAE